MKNFIPNTNNNLMLAVLLHEHDSEQPVDVVFIPVIGWSIEKYDQLRVWAIGTDNDDENLKIIFNVDSSNWYVLNKQITGSGKDDLIELINLNKKIEIKI